MEAVIRSADGTGIAVRRTGSGPPVVMLHGSGGGLHSWAAVADLLADRYEVWLLARRGYAPSDVPAGTKTFAAEAADVRAVLAAAGPAHLVGSSYGATVALHAALADPAVIRSVGLYEPPLFAAGPDLAPVLERYETLLAAGDVHGATMLFVEQVARVPAPLLAVLAAADDGGDPVEARRSAVGSLHDLRAMAGDGVDVRRWAGVRVPTLLMQGADSWEPLPATMDALAAVLPDVERAIWPGQMHFATTTAPELVARTIGDFLGRVDAGG